MNRLAVYLHGVRVGFLADGDEPVFGYDPGWLASGPDHALSRQLPLQAEPFSGRVVRAFFSGLLPEADPRDRIASILGISGGNDFAMLERIGGECAGGFPFYPRKCHRPPRRQGGCAGWTRKSSLRSWKDSRTNR